MISCPLCHAPMDELKTESSSLDRFFTFRCGTMYGFTGGLGMLRASWECRERRGAMGSVPVKPVTAEMNAQLPRLFPVSLQ